MSDGAGYHDRLANGIIFIRWLGGGLGLAKSLSGRVLSLQRAATSGPNFTATLPIVRATTGPDAGLIGAAATAWQSTKQQLAP